MIVVEFTKSNSSLKRHEVNVKVDGKTIERSCLHNQFWLIDFNESYERTATQAAVEYMVWLTNELDESPNGPVSTQFNLLVEAHLNRSEVKIIVAKDSEHGAILRDMINIRAAKKGWAEPIESSLLYSRRMPKIEYAQRDDLSMDPSNETMWTTESLRQERIVRIIGNKQILLGIMISESEALVPHHDLVTLKPDRWFYDGAAASEEEKQELQAALTLLFHEEWFNEREVGRPESRFEDKIEACFADAGLALNDEDQLMIELAEKDEDQQLVASSVISWYHKRDVNRISDRAGLAITV